MKDLNDFFSSLNSFFGHIYVITLQRATDRHEHVRRELDGLNYEFFFGKDKQNFTIEELKNNGVYNEALAKQHHRYGKAMQAGQIGCSWSHAEVYKDVAKKGYQKVLILEDDVVIDTNTAPLFSEILQQLPNNWELFYLGFAERENLPPGLFFKKAFYHFLRLFKAINYSHTTINHLYQKKITDHIYHSGFHDCTHAYAITQSAAKKLLKLQQPVSFIADNLLAYAVTNQIVKGYNIVPQIINQQSQVGIDSVSYLNE